MARFCFYCSRELLTGEKCNCRSTGRTASGSQSSSAAGNSPDQQQNTRQSTAGKSKAAKTSRGSFRRFFSAFNPFAAETANRATAGGARRTSRAAAGSRTARPVRKPLNLQTVLSVLRQFGQYVLNPVDSIRASARTANNRTVLAILLAQGLCGGLLFQAATGLPLIRALMSLSMATLISDGVPAIDLFIFFQGFGISMASTLLLALLYQLALRFLYRRPVTYFKLLSGFGPASLYLTFFLLGGLLTLSSSPLSAALIVLAGFAVGTAAQYIAIIEISGFDQNRSFILVTFVMLIYTSVLSIILNLSLPFLKVIIDQTAVF